MFICSVFMAGRWKRHGRKTVEVTLRQSKEKKLVARFINTFSRLDQWEL